METTRMSRKKGSMLANAANSVFEMPFELPLLFEPFVKQVPCAVMTRLILEWLMDEALLNDLFDEVALTQYHREFALSHLVAVMLDVACGTHPSARQAFLARQEEMPASLTAFYEKLKRVEPGVMQELIERTARRCRDVIVKMKGTQAEPIPGFTTKVLDGNCLAGTEHRLEALRNSRAGALPGRSLAMYECRTGLIDQLVLWEDGHSQERALLRHLELQPGLHLLADRNFCVAWFMDAIENAESCFTIRQHRGSFSLATAGTLGAWRSCGRCKSGRVEECTLRRVEAETGKERTWRVIRLKLNTPTREGETEVVLISNLPASVKAACIAMSYLARWRIEGHFQRLTEYLNCEVPSLGYPRAALFAFAMSVLAGNAVAMLESAIRAVHGNDAADMLSWFGVAHEISAAYRGMMVALPPKKWEIIQGRTPGEMACVLRHIASHANLIRLRKTIRGPKKPRRTPNCGKTRHVSTYRVLNESRKKRC